MEITRKQYLTELMREHLNDVSDLNCQIDLLDTDTFDEFEIQIYQVLKQFALCKRHNALVRDISNSVNKGMGFDEVLHNIYESFKEVIHYERMSCLLINEKKELEIAWFRTEYTDKVQLNRGFSLKLEDTSIEEMFSNSEPRIINDLRAYYAKNPDSISTRLAIKEGIASNFSWPLVAGDNPVGFLIFSSRKVNQFSRENMHIFRDLASNVAYVVEKSRLYNQIERLNTELTAALTSVKEQACIDSLTQIYHRGTILEFLEHAIAQSHRTFKPFCIIMLDIDYFKVVNDTYGHLVGDDVLLTVAKTIKKGLRKYDSVGRYGGEEFLIVLNETDYVAAFDIAERIRRSIMRLEFSTNDQVFNVTVSLGIATSESCIDVRCDQDKLLLKADNALYRAKNQGRNRVIVDQPTSFLKPN
ncbi:sensor domain-containing diguanylate cyclase [Vibrio sp.]|nr:sensor domain-containing diguanylate cyclase [Vibrio sp.]